MADSTFWAWLAGFIDGEGCITSGKTRKKGTDEPHYYFRICIVNTNHGVLDYIMKHVGMGGSISEFRRSSSRWKRAYCLTYGGTNQCKHVLGNILPHLQIKRPQAEAVLEALSTYRYAGSSPVSEEAMQVRRNAMDICRAMNKRGITNG